MSTTPPAQDTSQETAVISYGNLGWERSCVIPARGFTGSVADSKFLWKRPEKGGGIDSRSSFGDDRAYVRKVELPRDEGDLTGGRVTLIASDKSEVDSVIKRVHDGRIVAEGVWSTHIGTQPILTGRDIISAHKMSLDDKTKWFHDLCTKICENDIVKTIDIQGILLNDSMEAVMLFSRRDLRRPWQIYGQNGYISTQEWYESIMSHEELGLWQRSTTDQRMQINFLSEMSCPTHLKYFRFFGRILGRALLDKQLLNFRLAKHLYKLLLGWPLVLNDLKDLDEHYYNYLKSLRDMGRGVNNLGLHFTVIEDLLGLRNKVPLIPNGQDIRVTKENLPEYIDACLKYQLFGRCEAQSKELILGFIEVVPEPSLVAFDFLELEALMCGSYTGGKTEEGDEEVGEAEQNDIPLPLDYNAQELAEEETVSTAEIGRLRSDSCASAEPTSHHSVSSSISEQSPLLIPEAYVVADDSSQVYEAISFDAEMPKRGERNYRIKRGQCPSCGMQTHKVRRLKRPVPLSNQFVLNGRCLQCNPVQGIAPGVAGRMNDDEEAILGGEGLVDDARRRSNYKKFLKRPWVRSNEGKCPKCGIVQTHKKNRFGKASKAETIPGTVYKGICIKCHTLHEAKQILGEPVEAQDVVEGAEETAHGLPDRTVPLSSPESQRVGAIPSSGGQSVQFEERVRAKQAAEDEARRQGVQVGAMPTGGRQEAAPREERVLAKEEAMDELPPSAIGQVEDNEELQELHPLSGEREEKQPAKKAAENEVMKVPYGINDGWERTVLNDDLYGTMLQWALPEEENFAYVRKIQYSGSSSNVFSRRYITLVPVDEALVDPTITSADGHVLMDHSDMLPMQKRSYEEKAQWFGETCNSIRARGDELTLRVRRESLLTDSMEFIIPLSANDLQKKWKIEIRDNKGGKASLPVQEWFDLVVEKVIDPSLGLLQRVDCSNQMRFQINPASEKACTGNYYDHLIYFRFMGRVLGRALFERHQVNFRFSKLLYKFLLGWPIVLDDLKGTDEQYYNFLNALKDLGTGVNQLGLNFSVMGESEISDGPDIDVNEKNLPEYIEACLKHQTHGQYESQLNELILGFYDIMSEPMLSIFDYQELEELLCGPCVPVHYSLLGFSRAEIEEQCSSLEILAEEILKAFVDETDSKAFETDPVPLAKYVSRVCWPVSSKDFVVGLRVETTVGRNQNLIGSIINIIDSKEEEKQEIRGFEEGEDEAVMRATVHFDGYSSRWDETYSIEDFRNGRLNPLYTHAPLPKPTNIVVYHRGVDHESKSFYIFDHSFQIQCEHEWSLGRVGAFILAQMSMVLKPNHFVAPSDGKKLSPLECVIGESKRRETCEVIASMVKELIQSDQQYTRSTIEIGKTQREMSALHVISESLSNKIDQVLPLLPFEIRVTAAKLPLGTNKKEALFPFLLDRTIGNYTSSDFSLVLHWRKERDFASDQFQLEAEAEELRVRGSDAFMEGSLDEAIELYTKAIELNPTDHQTFANRSATFFRLGDRDSAKKDIASILLIKPQCSRGYYQKGAALAYLERCEDAISVFEEGLAKYPNDSALSSGLAYAKESCPLKNSQDKRGDESASDSKDESATAADNIVDDVETPTVMATSTPLSATKDIESPPSLTLTAATIALGNNQGKQQLGSDDDDAANRPPPGIETIDEAKVLEPTPPVACKTIGHEDGNGDDDECSLDELGRLAREAARKLQITLKFQPRPDGNVPPNAMLLCNNPLNPSDLTWHSHWRKHERPVSGASPPQSTIPTSPEDDTDKDTDSIRKSLISIAENLSSEPVQLPPAYVEDIKTETKIGGGYYGKVMLGTDSVIGKRFAIKVIEPLVIEQSLTGLFAGRLDSIQKTFRNEIKILSHLRHPNIAPLYGYCMDEGGLQNTCLVYELATNGSLDLFWKDTLGRERLSDWKVRARIAFEVAAVLRFMHEGLAGGAACYHRDIKSANICLTADLSVRVVDCGLSKYVCESPGSFSSAGPVGTPGYICPEYWMRGVFLGSPCDVFSFGVLLADLILGKTSCAETSHYLTYRRSTQRLEGDADECVDWGSGQCLHKMAKLASRCMRTSAKDRPLIGNVVKQLKRILNDNTRHRGSPEKFLQSKSSSEDVDEIQTFGNNSLRCYICGEASEKFIQCGEQHTHCNNCVERQVLRNINSFNYSGIVCLKDCCESKPFPDEAIARLVSRDTWTSYSMQRNSGFSMENIADSASKHVWNISSMKRDITSMENRVTSLVEEKFRQMNELQVKLSAGNGLPCPKLFYLVEAGASSWRHPREWARNAGSSKLYLYFVCSHSGERVSDKCRVKLRYSRDWMKAIAPAFNLSLDLLQLSLGISIGRDCPLDFAKIKDLDEWAKDFLDNDERGIFEEAKSRDGIDSSLQTLVGNSLSFVAEKAASLNVKWQSELVPVFDYERKEPTFVMSRYASEPRYQSERDVVFNPQD